MLDQSLDSKDFGDPSQFMMNRSKNQNSFYIRHNYVNKLRDPSFSKLPAVSRTKSKELSFSLNKSKI
jgi:hypothetical protein